MFGKLGLGLGLGGGGGSAPYGVSFNFSLPVSGEAGKYYRLGALAEYNDALGALPWSTEIGQKCRIQSRMRRCVMPDTISDPTNPQKSVRITLTRWIRRRRLMALPLTSLVVMVK